MTTLLTMRGPPQPPHQHVPAKPTGPHHGMTGSPKPSATQLTIGKPTPTDTPTPGAPKNETSAGAYTGATTTGPGAQPQKLSAYIQRPVEYGAQSGGTSWGTHTWP